MKAIEIPTLTFTQQDYNKGNNEIVINLNTERQLDHLINDYQKTHRRIFPQINLLSPTQTIANFVYPRLDGWEIVYEGKNCNVRLTYK